MGPRQLGAGSEVPAVQAAALLSHGSQTLRWSSTATMAASSGRCWRGLGLRAWGLVEGLGFRGPRGSRGSRNTYISVKLL